ncbi:MAG: hypothetical protein ABFR36_01965 [Acidobacteriota bacterium]
MKRVIQLLLVLIFSGMCFVLLQSEDTREGLDVSKDPEDAKSNLNEEMLENILAGSAKYCSKLKSSAFHFFCKETIISQGNRLANKTRHYYGSIKRDYINRYFFDYQLINNSSGVREQRKRLSGKKKQNNEIHDLVISFLSEKPVFAPVMILGNKGQTKFKFKFNGISGKGNNRYVEIQAIPIKPKNFFFKSALLYVDPENYSVRKMDVIPRYIKGYERLMRIAFNFRAKLYLECEISFDKEYKGLWFPTEIVIREKYKGGRIITQALGISGLTKSETSYTYDEYRFFNVDMDIKK